MNATETSRHDDTAGAVAALLERAQDQARTATANRRLFDARQRLDEPLRLAIAGKVKAGKSTLLNALLGEPLAATDAGECTRLVTWYRYGPVPTVRIHLRDGTVKDTVWSRDAQALTIDMDGHEPERIDHIEVVWPSRQLRDITVIDSPGVASISTDVSMRSHAVLTSEPGRVPIADAVIYLLRHAHASDIRFLESFHDSEVAHGTPVNAVGVLGRADEIGSARLQAMNVAEDIAARYELDPRLRRLTPTVVAVDGILALSSTTLDAADHEQLIMLADLPAAETNALLLTTDRFTTRPVVAAPSPEARALLIRKLGLFGTRLGIELLRARPSTDPASLRHEFARISGLDRLNQVLLVQFRDRSRLLRARTALASLQDVLAADGCVGGAGLRTALERLIAGDHELEELRMLVDLRSAATDLKPDRAAELELLVGGRGRDVRHRLGLPPAADQQMIIDAASTALAGWRRLAGRPMSSRATQRAAAVAVRTLEGVIVNADRQAGRASVTQIKPSRTA